MTLRDTQQHRITFFLAPVARDVGLTSMVLGLLRALQRDGLNKIGFVKPIAQPCPGPDLSAHFAHTLCHIETPPTSIAFDVAEQRVRTGEVSALMEDVVKVVEAARTNGCDVVLVQGLPLSAGGDENPQLASQLNAQMARALGAHVIPVISGTHYSSLAESIEMVTRQLTDDDGPSLAGFLINKIPPMADEFKLLDPQDVVRLKGSRRIPLLGSVPFEPRLNAPRLADMVSSLGLQVLREGSAMASTRVYGTVVAARSPEHMLAKLKTRPGALVVTPGDRSDVVLATVLAFMLGAPVAGLLLTCGEALSPEISSLVLNPQTAGLTILATEDDTFATNARLATVDYHLYNTNDPERINQVLDYVAERINTAPLMDKIGEPDELRLTPPAFRNLLVQMAIEANKRIVLPEGDEPRTLHAVDICHRKGIARCILLGNPITIQKAAISQGITLPADVEIIDPDQVRERYIAPMMELRKSKGLTAEEARAQLQDTVVLGTVMLALGEVDGLVSGAIHTTASTVRPALQLIKTAPQAKLVSSVFFMLMPSQMLVFGDCAINPNPSAEDLADIALQTADSAAMFGVEPRVAMISYASGASARGSEVSKVIEALRIARERRPGLLIDGPMQYDAATVPSVGRQKMPNSAVAGQANVFVYPDLNTGNTVYKAVQRSAKVVSIGPVLTGLRKAVNDLSRGSSVDDIVYTIALTTIQAAEAAGNSSPLEKRRRSSLDRDALYNTMSNGTVAAAAS